MNKYHNRKTVIDNITFMSKKEADYYQALKFLLRGKAIKDLKLQPRFELQPSFTDSQGNKHRKIEYVSDFAYHDIRDGKLHIVDCKGIRTSTYILKSKIFLYFNRNNKDMIFEEV